MEQRTTRTRGSGKKGVALFATLLAAIFGLSLVGSGLSGCGGGGGTEGVLPGVTSLVFVKRAFERGDGSHDVAGGSGQVIDYLRYTPGGGVFTLTPPTPDGELVNLTEDFRGVDIAGLDLSFDAQEVVFSMRHQEDTHYHIYVANVDGSGEVRQLTFGPRHDVRPLFIPGDRIAFVTNEPYTDMGTRADEYNHSRVVTQIATVSIDMGDADRRLCSQNLSHTADPFLLSDGTIGFSRWEHLGPTNDVKLFRMNPDCSQMTAIAGQFNKPFNSLVQFQELEPGVFVGIGTSRMRTIQSGALIRVDARSGTSTNPELTIDVQQATFQNLTPAVPTGEDSSPSGVGRYRYPRSIPGRGEMVVSWANGDVNDRNELVGTAPNFGIYMWDPATQQRTLVYDDPDMWDQYAIPVVARDEPPVIAPVVDAQPDAYEPAVIGSVDVTATSLPETVRGGDLDGMALGAALAHATHVRIVEGFSSEIGAVRMFGLTMHEGAAILGETPVYEDGSWEAQVPAYLPYHLQPIDRFGMAIRNQMLWIQAMPGESRRCGGCHADRSGTVLPRMGSTTLAQQAGADTTTLRHNVADRVELPWYGAASGGNLQDVFNAACVSCHNESTTDYYTVTVSTMDGEMYEYQVPTLDLSERSVEAYYEEETVSYPASYVSLLYPSAMMGDSVATGAVPPEWVTPGSARTSYLIQYLNMMAEDDPSATAWDAPMHPEDVGGSLTREQRLMLIQMADLGGQYYSRRNVDGAAGTWTAP